MARVYILNTCDAWKTHSSFCLYGIWASSKIGTRRLVNALIKGIKNGDFAYNDEQADTEEQIKSLREDTRGGCLSLYQSLQSKLIYGAVQLEEIR